MSAVSAEENITVDDGTDSTSDYVEFDSGQGYNENNIYNYQKVFEMLKFVKTLYHQTNL